VKAAIFKIPYFALFYFYEISIKGNSISRSVVIRSWGEAGMRNKWI
jgi:hypothetical protein